MLRKYLKWIILVIVLILRVVYYSFFRKKDDGVKYLTEVVKRSDISQTIVASGTLRSNDRVEVGAQVSGKITKINVVLGQEVKKGDLIATIDSLTQNNNLDEAKSKLKVYQAQRKSASVKYQVAQSKFNRISKLYQMNSISQDEYESAKEELEVATVANPDKTYKSTVQSVDYATSTLTDNEYSESVSNTSAVYYYANIILDNKDGNLRIGMTTTNTITINSVKNVLSVPVVAVQKVNGKSVVKVVKDKEKNIIEEREVTTGIQDGLSIEIKSGLSEGEEVVVTQLNGTDGLDSLPQRRM